jgi:hypothetical protein
MPPLLSAPRPLTCAPPKLHSVVIIVGFLAYFLYRLPSLESLDEVATIEAFTNRIFPKLISLQTLVYIRLLFATSIWITSFHTSCISSGWVQSTTYLPGSKLKMIPNRISGIKTMYDIINSLTHLVSLFTNTTLLSFLLQVSFY